MDKYEYKVRADEIKSLVAGKQYADAAKVADTIDWTRVKSVMMLTIVSDIYKVNRRYEDSKAVLILAYERHSGGRAIVYSLCELAIKMEEYVQAVEYYKEFVQIAPRDTGRYILQYKLYEAQEVSLEERISVLEEFKRKDYREKWAYELAYLYHRIGLETRCVEECDELVLWFGDGKYVLKAMELKKLHEPLNPLQQDNYDKLTGRDRKAVSQHLTEQEEAEEEDSYDEHDDIHVKTPDMSKYNTINLQKELADSMKEFMYGQADLEQQQDSQASPELRYAELPRIEEQAEEVFFEEGKTGRLPVREAVGTVEETKEESDHTEESNQTEDLHEKDTRAEKQEAEEITEHAANIREFTPKNRQPIQETAQAQSPEELGETREYVPLDNIAGITGIPLPLISPPLNPQPTVSAVLTAGAGIRREHEFERMLAQEYDGQLSLVVPEGDSLEKQITGQMDIHDILTSWEEAKKQNQEKRMDDVKRKVSEHTGQLFSEFDEASKNDLLSKLEEASRIEESRHHIADTPKAAPDEGSGVASEEIPMDIKEEPAASKEPEHPQEEYEASKAIREETENQADTEVKPVSVRQDSGKSPRNLSEEEEELFGFLLHSKKARRELVAALDAISLAPHTGNILVAGEEHGSSMEAAMNLIKEIQLTDSNFSGKVAKVTASALEGKNIAATFGKLENGALIVEKAGALSGKTMDKILKVLDQGNKGIIIVMEDAPQNIDILLERHEKMKEVFNARITVPQMNNDALVEHARSYALEQEYAIDDLGILALYTRIAEMQTSDHVVSTQETEEIVEDAIYYANKKSLPHFVDILFGTRYDEEDMIILREKDFINY